MWLSSFTLDRLLEVPSRFPPPPHPYVPVWDGFTRVSSSEVGQISVSIKTGDRVRRDPGRESFMRYFRRVTE